MSYGTPENKLTELLVRIKDIEIKLIEVSHRLSELEKKNDKVTGYPKNRTDKSPGQFELQEFKEFQGALFRREKRGFDYDAVFCEECRVKLFSHDNDLMVCPECGKTPGFNRSDMLKMVQALNSGKAG